MIQACHWTDGGQQAWEDHIQMIWAAFDGKRWGCRSVGKIFGIAPSTAGNWHRGYRQTQSYAARPMGGDHRSKLIAHVDRIANLLAQTSDLTLTDVRATLASIAGQA